MKHFVLTRLSKHVWAIHLIQTEVQTSFILFYTFCGVKVENVNSQRFGRKEKGTM